MIKRPAKEKIFVQYAAKKCVISGCKTYIIIEPCPKTKIIVLLLTLYTEKSIL